MWPWPVSAGSGGGKSLRSLPRAEDLHNAGVGRKRGAALDRRDGEIELGSAALPRQRDANRMKQRLPLLAGLLLDAVRHRAERLAVEQRPLDRLGQRGDDLARTWLVQQLRDGRTPQRLLHIERE